MNKTKAMRLERQCCLSSKRMFKIQAVNKLVAEMLEIEQEVIKELEQVVVVKIQQTI